MTDILTTITVIGAIIILLQVMIIISYWRRGSKYGAMERVYRQRQAEMKAKEVDHVYHPIVTWDIDEEDEALRSGNTQAILDDSLDPN